MQFPLISDYYATLISLYLLFACVLVALWFGIGSKESVLERAIRVSIEQPLLWLVILLHLLAKSPQTQPWDFWSCAIITILVSALIVFMICRSWSRYLAERRQQPRT